MKNADQPAFANPGSDQGPGSSGLTKREYFAAMAMQGLVSSVDILSAVGQVSQSGSRGEFLAELAIQMADELLKKLES